ncbi:MAG: divalent metal cation transporter [Acidobacteria bacterium]|nr:MAG: divalent metal cation transporter [Acidobacteriota bacterium]
MPVITERRVHHRPLPHLPAHTPGGTVQAVGTGIITGAADDDPSAIGTYASAGAAFGPGILWAAPVLFPLMTVVMYLAAKIGHVSGVGFAAVIRQHYPRWILTTVVVAIVAGNVIEAAADLGGVGAALHLLSPLPGLFWVLPIAAGILAIQLFGSYTWIRNAFRWLALALLAYIGSALLAKPDLLQTVKATLVPQIHWNRDYLAVLVAMIGTSGSTYLYGWQASQQVEEDISMGRRRLSDRTSTTSATTLKSLAWDVVLGMFFSVVIMYFILLSTAATIYPTRWGSIHTAAEAAQALAPLAGHAAGVLFAVGVIAVGFLAIPVMTIGAAYVVCDAAGWKSGLSAKRKDAPQFYWIITAVMIVAAGLNYLGMNPIHALIAAGIVQGFLAPGLMLLLLLITCNPRIMGPWTNSRWVTVVAGLAALASAAAAVALIVSLH